VEKRHNELAEVLLLLGADPNICNKVIVLGS
jgi:hypothetical protein